MSFSALSLPFSSLSWLNTNQSVENTSVAFVKGANERNGFFLKK